MARVRATARARARRARVGVRPNSNLGQEDTLARTHEDLGLRAALSSVDEVDAAWLGLKVRMRVRDRDRDRAKVRAQGQG